MVAASLSKQDFTARNSFFRLSLYLSRISLTSAFNLIKCALLLPLVFFFLVSLLACSSWSDILTLPGSCGLLFRNYFSDVLNRRKRTVRISSNWFQQWYSNDSPQFTQANPREVSGNVIQTTLIEWVTAFQGNVFLCFNMNKFLYIQVESVLNFLKK